MCCSVSPFSSAVQCEVNLFHSPLVDFSCLWSRRGYISFVKWGGSFNVVSFKMFASYERSVTSSRSGHITLLALLLLTYTYKTTTAALTFCSSLFISLRASGSLLSHQTTFMQFFNVNTLSPFPKVSYNVRIRNTFFSGNHL